MIQLLFLILLPGIVCRPSEEAPAVAPAPPPPEKNNSNETDFEPRNTSSRYSFYNHGVDNDTLLKMNPEEIAAFTEVFKLWANDTLNAQQKMEFLEKELNISDEDTAVSSNVEKAVMNTLNITLSFADFIHEQKKKLDPKLQEVVNKILSKMTDFNFITQDADVIDAFINDTTNLLDEKQKQKLEEFDKIAEEEMKKLGLDVYLDDDDDKGNSTESDAKKDSSKEKEAHKNVAMNVHKEGTEASKENNGAEKIEDEKDSVETHDDKNSEEKDDKKAGAKFKRSVMEEETGRHNCTTARSEVEEDTDTGPEPTGDEEKKKKRHAV